MRRVLVLGTGQIGTFSARAIAEQEAHVVAVDVEPTPGYFWRYGPKQLTQLLTANILDTKTLQSTILEHKIDTVVLSAGTTNHACAKDPNEGWRINVEGTRKVVGAILQSQVERIVFLSTLAVYGCPPTDRISESTPLAPQSEYGRSKSVAEEVLGGLRDAGRQVAILRPCGTFGPLRLGSGSQSAQFMESLLIGAVRHVSLTIEASKASSDEYIYIKDLAKAVALAALSDLNGAHSVFNVGAGRKTNAEELCAALRTVVPDVKVRIKEPLHKVAQPMPPLDISHIEKTLGFRPEFDLRAGFSDYINEAGFR